MKGKLTTHYCMSKSCDWSETSHKLLDGINCPKCNGPVMSAEPKKKYSLTPGKCVLHGIKPYPKTHRPQKPPSQF